MDTVSEVLKAKENEFVKKLTERGISINKIEDLAETEIIDLFDINADS